MAKTYRNLYPHITTWGNLMLARRKARRGGMRSPPMPPRYHVHHQPGGKRHHTDNAHSQGINYSHDFRAPRLS
jgi:hypothetical protein